MSPSADDERRGFLVIGRVQGVGFRWWTRRCAQSYGLRGTVRNRPEGSVEVHVAGPAAALESFRAQLDAGPPGARVDLVTPVPSDHDLADGFHVIF